MRSLPRMLAVGGVLWAAAFLPTALAQDKSKGDKVRFESADGVDLHGTFYASAKANPPTVLIVHAVGESSKQRGWTHLAEQLQQKGFAVLAFDLRGHGASTEVLDPAKFWGVSMNRIFKGLPKAITLDAKDFPSGYLPMLCNDIAAARSFLDRKNDMGSSNVSNLILVGADSGGALGAMWLHSEWSRYRCKPPPLPGMAFPLVLDTNIPEGNDVIACVWLSINPKLASNPKVAARNVKVADLLMLPAKTKAVPMLFMHSAGDKKGKDYALMLEKSLVGSVKEKTKIKDDKYRFTGAAELEKSKLTGSDLLQKSLPTAQQIADYLKDVVEAKGQEWVERQFLKTPYAWRSANGNLFLANKIGDKTLNMKDYAKDYSGYLR